MRVVVTGATGNVGTAVLRSLMREPAVSSIVGVARRLDPLPRIDRVTWRSGDVRDRAFVDEVVAGADAVVHLAWAIQPSRDRVQTRSINVDGSRAVFEASAAAGVGALVYASSVGAYAPAGDDALRDESWPTTGIRSSFYSVDKADTERALDVVAAGAPRMRVARLRPGLIFQRTAAQEIRRLFAGPLLPRFLLRPGVLPVLPAIRGVRFQAVHSDDVADAYRRCVVDERASGAYNIATEDVLDLHEVARVLRVGRTVPVPFAPVRALADLSWRARLQPTPAGWLDLAAHAPLLSSARARRELGWNPARRGHEALGELLAGMRAGEGDDTPPLHPGAGGTARLHEVLTGVGARNP